MYPYRNYLLVVLIVQNPQNSQEQVEDVQVKRDRSGDLLLNVVMAHNQLSINENISREDQRRQPTVDQLRGAIVREERRHEPEENQEPKAPEEIGHPVGEVVFGLAGEQGERDEDAEGEDERLDDDAGVIEGGHHADGVGF